MDFSDSVKILRQSQFLSQMDFAKELGISFATVNRWETKKAKPTYRTLRLLDEFCKKHHIDYNVAKEFGVYVGETK